MEEMSQVKQNKDVEIPTQQKNSETSIVEDDGESQKLSCHYKPLSSPILRHRKQPISMFDIPANNGADITEVQELCIETGSEQPASKEHDTILPRLESTEITCPTLSDNRPEVNSETFREMSSNEDLQRKVVTGKHEGWIGVGSEKEPQRIPSCPTASQVNPRPRRRSLGVLMSPAWGLRTYRDPEGRNTSRRRRSLVLPSAHHTKENSVRRKSLVSLDVTKLTTPKHSMNCDQHPGNSVKQREKAGDQPRKKSDPTLGNELLDDFRPRLRSHSLGEYRTQARENVLQRQRQHLQEPENNKQRSRRKSFEVWLTDKEQETIRKLHKLALERQREVEKDARKKEQRKGKTYEEWLSEKNNMVPAKEDCSSESVRKMSEDRQEIAQRRYEKWLMEKEMQALEKEREMLERAKLKTTEMRKKYEEKKRLNFLKSSLIA